jgi:hypothetical protein
MSKLIQSILTGMLMTFILDFFIFLGIFLHYIKKNEIDIYYNILFIDHQDMIIYFSLSFILGILVIYINNTKFSFMIIISLAIVSFSSLIPSIGENIGERLLMKKNVTFHNEKYSFHGDMYYNGRKQIVFYDYELKKTIILEKKDIKQ